MKQIKRPKLPKKITPASVAKWKAAMRRYDRERIKAGLATPEQVQKENSVFPEFKGKVRIVNFS